MSPTERAATKAKVLKNYELHKLQTHRMKRLLRAPFKTLPFYVLNALSKVRPYRVHKKTLWGDTMTYYLPEANAIYYYGFFEANLINFFLNYFRRGQVFVDIGAHVGHYTVLTARLVEDSGAVYAFEPTPRTFESLERNVAKFPNVHIAGVAMMNKPGTIEFTDYGPRYSAFNSFKSRTSTEVAYMQKYGHTISVPAVAYDEYARAHKIRADFIKIDAEGAEHLILSGMKETLKYVRPLVSIEVSGGEEWKENCARSISQLKEHGYVPFEIDINGSLHPHTVKESYAYDNLIMIPEEKSEAVIRIVNATH